MLWYWCKHSIRYESLCTKSVEQGLHPDIFGCPMLGSRFDIMITVNPCYVHYDGGTSQMQDNIMLSYVIIILITCIHVGCGHQTSILLSVYSIPVRYHTVIS